MYSGLSGRKMIASANMKTGPITQFWMRERPRTFLSRKTAGNSSYRTLAKGGYIIKMRPSAIGTFVAPIWKESMKPLTLGTSVPSAMPAPIAAKIHTVR